jgi:4-amino-4-deoxy-L-arabinose transferase-like glycosyltransferase
MKREGQKAGVQIAVALVAGLALRLFFVVHAPRIAGDTLLYGDIAKNWMQHGVYGFAQGPHGPVPTLIRLPGYPMFLALCFAVFGADRYTAVMVVQCLIDLATCLLVAHLVRRLFGGRAAVPVLWLGVLCPFTANYVAAPLTEMPSLLCIALAFYGMERWRAAGRGWNGWLWTIAATLAYAVLLRPEQGLLAAAVVPAMFWMAWRDSRELRAAAPVLVAAVCVVVPLVPWAARNWSTFHVFEPLAPRYATDPGEEVPIGFQRWFRSWGIDFASTEQVYWNWDSAPIDIADVPTRAFDTEEQYSRTALLLTEYNKETTATPKLDAGFDALAKERIADDPVRYYLALPMARLLDMALRPRTEMMEIDLEWWRGSKHPGQTAFATAYGLLNLAYLVLGGLGLWRWRRSGWDSPLAWSMIAFVALRCLTLLTLDNAEQRYTLELFPVLLVWSGAVFRGRAEAAAEKRAEIRRDLPGRPGGVAVGNDDLAAAEEAGVQ